MILKPSSLKVAKTLLVVAFRAFSYATATSLFLAPSIQAKGEMKIYTFYEFNKFSSFIDAAKAPIQGVSALRVRERKLVKIYDIFAPSCRRRA